MKNEVIERCADDYNQSIDRLAKLVLTIVERLEGELKRRGIQARVSGRVKSHDSLHNKLKKWTDNKNKLSELKKHRGVFNVVGDLAAVRVMTYVEQDREIVSGIVKEVFRPRAGNKNFEIEEKENDTRIKGDPNNFYRATHMQICLKEADLVGDNANLNMDHCELQITSMLAHVWNEIEHDIVYKGDKSELLEEERLALNSLGLLTKSGDNIIASLIMANNTRKDKQKCAEKTLKEANELSDFFKDIYGEKVNGKIIDYNKNSQSLLNVMSYLGLNHPDRILQEITPRLLCDVSRTANRFKKYLEKNKVTKPSFELDTCDIFYAVLLSKYHSKIVKMEVHGGQREKALASHFNKFILI